MTMVILEDSSDNGHRHMVRMNLIVIEISLADSIKGLGRVGLRHGYHPSAIQVVAFVIMDFGHPRRNSASVALSHMLVAGRLTLCNLEGLRGARVRSGGLDGSAEHTSELQSR